MGKDLRNSKVPDLRDPTRQVTNSLWGLNFSSAKWAKLSMVPSRSKILKSSSNNFVSDH